MTKCEGRQKTENRKGLHISRLERYCEIFILCEALIFCHADDITTYKACLSIHMCNTYEDFTFVQLW